MTEFHPEPLVKYQGDQYVDRDGATYVVTIKPNEVNRLGTMTSKQSVIKEILDWYQALESLTPDSRIAKFTNTIIVKRAMTDDTSIGLYYMDDQEALVRIFYRTVNPKVDTLNDTKILFVYADETLNPKVITLTDTKILFVYVDDSCILNTKFQDAYQQNFEAITEREAMRYSYNGFPAVKALSTLSKYKDKS